MMPGGAARPSMTVEEFRLLRDLIYEHCGIDYREENLYLLERRLWPRLQVHGLTRFSAYHQLLRYDAGRRAELDAAIECVATHETYFFRDPNQLRAFSEELIPLLLAQATGRRLRIWSAGCSSGEEAYTIAMLLLEEPRLDGWDLEVFGTDISQRVLSIARQGEYGQSSLRESDPARVSRWLTMHDGRLHVTPELRRIVTFGQLNLLEKEKLALVGKVDVVVCRNVMIYLDLPARQRVLRGLYDRLMPGGYLLVGHAESLIHATADFEFVHLRNDLIYRRPRTEPR